MTHAKLFSLFALVFVILRPALIFGDCADPMPAASAEVTVKPLQWTDSPAKLSENPAYEIGGLYPEGDTSTRVGTVYAAHRASRVFINLEMEPDRDLVQVSLRMHVDWDNDSCGDHAGSRSLDGGARSAVIVIDREHLEGEHFHLFLEAVTDPGGWNVRSPVDLDTALKLVFGGDDAWN